MRQLSLRSIQALVLLLIISTVSSASNGRSFAGVFNLRDVKTSNALVSFTLDLQLQNRSGSQITGATVTLQDRFSAAQSFGSFSSIQINSPGLTVLSGKFSVPAREFALWQKGVTPNLQITYRDASGQLLSETINVVRGAVAGVN